MQRRTFVAAGMSLPLASLAARSARAAGRETVHFGVGPLLPAADDTKKTYEPFFAYLADKLGVDYSLTATTDWAGISVALANEQVDVAWMGPFGYVLANNDSGARAIATAKYDGKPIYHAIIIGRSDLKIARWPEDAKGLSMQFADVGSTSGWLIPTYWFQQHHIDPKTFFKYRDGSTHAANEIAVANGLVDLATDYDRNRNAMIEKGTIAKDASKIVYTFDPLPNDAIAVRKGFDAGMTSKLEALLLAITDATAATILPKHYDGFVPTTRATYDGIQRAALAVGSIKKKTTL